MPLFFKKLNATSAFASLYRTSIWKLRFSRISLNDLLIYFMLRYHYNVADARLAQHVERGIADGLLISCVASCSNLWALIMDAGTGFTSQVYELSPFFLHKVNFCATDAHMCHRCTHYFYVHLRSHTRQAIFKFNVGCSQEWIMEQWEKNFYISSIAGANNGSSLVVMSKGLFNWHQ